MCLFLLRPPQSECCAVEKGQRLRTVAVLWLVFNSLHKQTEDWIANGNMRGLIRRGLDFRQLVLLILTHLGSPSRSRVPASIADMTTVEPKDARKDPPPEGPDGGWGWVLVAALFVSNSLVFGLMRSSGIFFVEFVQYFDESAQAISWISSIGLAAQQFFSKTSRPSSGQAERAATLTPGWICVSSQARWVRRSPTRTKPGRW